MPQAPQGLLFVPGEVGSNLTDVEFNDWYDNEHVPLRTDISSFRSASRWIAVDDKRPSYLAFYDIDSCDVLDQPPYNTLANTASARERDVLRHVQLLDRRTYDLIEPDVIPPAAGYDESAPGPILITMEAEVKPELEDELNRWYREEHIPLLAKVPGWRRTRRFVLRDVGPANGTDAAEVMARGKKPKYLAVHEWESMANFDRPEFKHATRTPWRMKMFERADTWHGRTYQLRRAWAK
ncbi:hypothetical protein L226DRAFT_467674 [Lentinus tigrinus ALCF2SS1-7]|uniref:EthD domain-containing protein n=1 Tax=Lentinus tigrinus ALCF2SS1-6 TaxID=1328759 RepID=A0A5C2S2K7_9APHY|nr:hypothetical protein L227DRAFT_506351 [Lentinus tigrinus ALCF2SS1-6]RPD71922.1 hypothetical protein L226DRAFT_467674 [Lentinus tigrinus ALCF2SS1-7]